MKPEELHQLTKSLPHTPGIMGRENYLNSAIMVLLILVDGEYHFVFEKRVSGIRQGSEICFPGGKFDPEKDQDFLHTAVRETKEELGIPEDRIEVLGRMDTLITPQGVLVEAFVGTAEISIDEIKFDPYEVEYVFSVPVSFFVENLPDQYQLEVVVHPTRTDENGREEVLFPAKELGVPETYGSPWTGRKHNVYVYRVNHEIIWGITAVFIRNFVRPFLPVK